MTPFGEASVTVVSDDLDPLDRLESAEQIRQLVARFAMAYDARDLDTIAGLYAPDVREALMATLLERMPKGRTFHLTASPVVTFESADVARGDVVGRSEAEVGDKWMVIGRALRRPLRAHRRHLVPRVAGPAAAVRVRRAGPPMTATREERLERLDAYAQIRDLAVRYAAAMATKDRETLGLLYVEDVRVGGGLTGREALREAYFGAALDRLEVSVLHAGTHVIDLDPERPDRARGASTRSPRSSTASAGSARPSATSTAMPAARGRGCSSAATISSSTAPTTTSVRTICCPPTGPSPTPAPAPCPSAGRPGPLTQLGVSGLAQQPA